MSEADRWIVAGVLHELPWSGGENIVLAFHAIHETLELAKVPLNKTPSDLAKSTYSYALPAPTADLMIRALCGEMGGGVRGAAGPMLAKLVIRVRAQVRKVWPAAQQMPSVQTTR